MLTGRKICRPGNSVITIPTEQLVTSILNCAQLISGKTYRKYQEVYSAEGIILPLLLHEGGDISSLFSRQSGKSESTASTAAALALLLPALSQQLPDDWRLNYTTEEGEYQGFAGGISIGIYAPKKDQSKLTFNKLQNCLQSAPGQLLMAELGVSFEVANGQNIVLSNGSRIRCETASKEANIEGETFDLLILEECQDISDLKIQKSLEPMVAARDGLIVKVGTCGLFKGDFYYSILRHKRDYQLGRTKRRRHFYFPVEVIVKYNSSYRKHYEKQIEKYGEDSDFIQLSYKCKWLLERGQFMTLERFTRPEICLSSGPFSRFWRGAPKNMHVAGEGNFSVVAGIDFGKTSDSTVVAIVAVDYSNPALQYSDPDTFEEVVLYRKHLIGLLELQGDDYDTQFFAISGYLSQFKNLTAVYVDSTAAQDMMRDRMAAAYKVPVVGIPFSTPSKSEMYKNYLQDIQSHRFTFPGDPVIRKEPVWQRFVEQHVDLVKSYQGGYLVCAHPDIPGAHDDFPDAAALAVFGASKSNPQGEVIQTENVLFKRREKPQSHVMDLYKRRHRTELSRK